MVEEFDPSPRASKRQRVARYGTRRSVLEDIDPETVSTSNNHDEQRTSKRISSRGSNAVDEEHDSAPGLEETKLTENRHLGRDEALKGSTRSPTTNISTVARKRYMKVIGNGGGTETQSPFPVAVGSARKKTVENAPSSAVVSNDDNTRTQDHIPNRESTPPPQSEYDVVHTEHGTTPATRSSGRERRRPRRYSVLPQQPELVDVAKSEDKATATTDIANGGVQPAAILQPKGILTPSKSNHRGPRKSVLFDDTGGDIEQRLGFRDINASTKKARFQRSDRVEAGSTQKQYAAQLEEAHLGTSSPIAVSRPASDSLDEPELQSILDHFIDTPFEGTEPISEEETQAARLVVEEDDSQILAIKSTILSRLVSYSSSPLTQLETQYSLVHTLLSATVTTGESNSLLLLGARGVGKSLLLDMALKDLEAKHSEDFHTVRLNGFTQTDDKLAMREIWRQLGREMQIAKDETDEVSNYADTMASLLSLLSHPEDFGEVNIESNDGTRKAAKSVVFILDEFDLFTTHPRQTLLYNLFDIAQSRKAPIAVIGCSTRMDVVECLEKRVKSRFSHRWVLVSNSKSLAAFQETIQTALLLDADGAAALSCSASASKSRSRWNHYIKTTFLPSLSVQNLIKQIFYSSKSIPDLLITLYPLLAIVKLEDTMAGDTNPAFKHQSAMPSLLGLLPNLPILHLSLLAAASRLDTIYNLTSVNFNLTYAHYIELIAKTRLQQTASGAVAVSSGLRRWGREVARSAWEDLQTWEVIVPMSGSVKELPGGGGEGDDVRMWKVDVSLEELEWAVKEKWRSSGGGGSADILSKWCKEI